MAYEHKLNRGSLFKNDFKEKETHPDMKGDMNIGGEIYGISAWEETTKDGQPYLSLSLTTPEEMAKFAKNKKENAPSLPEPPRQPEDDIPF